MIVPSLERYVGQVLDEKYRLDRLLGEGGMGVVWSAVHVVTRKRVALKMLKPEQGADPRVRRAQGSAVDADRPAAGATPGRVAPGRVAGRDAGVLAARRGRHPDRGVPPADPARRSGDSRLTFPQASVIWCQGDGARNGI